MSDHRGTQQHMDTIKHWLTFEVITRLTLNTGIGGYSKTQVNTGDHRSDLGKTDEHNYK